MRKIVIISGATASGKTKTAVQFCKKNNGEIISCDSRQVYKYLDIGTNKEGIIVPYLPQSASYLREINGIKQYLTDIIEPDQKYSAADFVRDANIKIDEIIQNGKLPVIVGGAGLYIKSLLYGLDEMPSADENLRKTLSQKTKQELYEELLKCDKLSAEKNKDNPQRLLRALEVNILTGIPMGRHFKPKPPKFDFQHFSIKADSAALYPIINARCKWMLENGMIEETQKILKLGYKKDCPALSGIGYKTIIQFLENQISKPELLDIFCQDTRHYAKRQNTWFKAQTEIAMI
ncbi:MAG: tRNA (adenosine(37)-N6)-dimethylallyltransferase MiaA [Elusimicrobiota bacterium]|jgi:tRNA dimethylallyltransferase|nr:tRNA (adenosine(37)-N6)-dimethylallyltransferase MiaA [Elusimicrobiota bacterium]